MPSQVPETRYARNGDVNIAYQVIGDDGPTIVFVPPFVSSVELGWESPLLAEGLTRLAQIGRLVIFDKRGSGLSDRVAGVLTLEARMDDVGAVIDAVGAERAVIIGCSEGGPMSLLFAATYPERTLGVVLSGSRARWTSTPQYPWAPMRDEYERMTRELEETWGRPIPAAHAQTLNLGGDGIDPARLMRLSMTPGDVRILRRINMEIDVRAVLPAVRSPVLLIHREDDWVPIDGARYIAAHVPEGRLAALPGADHGLFSYADLDRVVSEIETFVGECVERESAGPERVVATVLFTDIVGSTARAAALGDRAWRELLEQHHRIVRRALSRHRGVEQDTAGDGFFASFDGPARAIRCACEIGRELRTLDLEIRSGLHTGECEILDGKMAGIAVSIGARVAAQASVGEVLISQTVKDLVAGSGLVFEERGAAELKGVPGEWRLYALADAAS